MAALTLQSMQTMREAMVAQAQGECSTLLDLSSGSPALAIIDADLNQWSVQQNNIYQVLLAMRLSTASGSDVDTFVADYGLTREPAVAASGSVTFSRYVSLGSATVPVGATVRTADASQTYTVTADPTNPLFSATAGTSGGGGYVLPPGTSSVTVPITAQVAGSAGNCVANFISLFGTAIGGIDLVTNATAIENGADPETDAALKTRFALFIQSLEKATLTAIEAAIEGVQQGITYKVLEFQDSSGAFQPGTITIIASDNTGNLSASLQSSIYAAVDAVRAAGVRFAIVPPAVATASVSMVVTLSSGTLSSLVASIQQAISAYIASLPDGGTISITRLASLAYLQSTYVSNVTNVTINGLPFDLVGTAGTIFVAGAVTVTN